MAQPISWPAVEPDAPPAPERLVDRLDPGSLAATLGPELSRLFGFRMVARPLPEAPAGSFLLTADFAHPVADNGYALAIGSGCAGPLIERLFGGAAEDAGGALPPLPPSSGSWLSLCRLLAAGVAKAVSALGNGTAGTPRFPQRPCEAPLAPGAAGQFLALETDGATCFLRLSAAPVARAAQRAPADLARWRERARSRAMALELPVTLRLPDRRMAIADVANLRPGDILPLERPRWLDLMVAGEQVGTLSAAAFGAGQSTDPETDDAA